MAKPTIRDSRMAKRASRNASSPLGFAVTAASVGTQYILNQKLSIWHTVSQKSHASKDPPFLDARYTSNELLEAFIDVNLKRILRAHSDRTQQKDESRKQVPMT